MQKEDQKYQDRIVDLMKKSLNYLLESDKIWSWLIVLQYQIIFKIIYSVRISHLERELLEEITEKDESLKFLSELKQNLYEIFMNMIVLVKDESF